MKTASLFPMSRICGLSLAAATVFAAISTLAAQNPAASPKAVAVQPRARAEGVIPENPGFTPEQAAEMAAQSSQSQWSKNILYPKGLVAPKETRAVITLDGTGGGRQWGGIGSTPAAAMERQLMHYPEEIREYLLDLMFKPSFGMALTHLKVEVGGDNNSTAAVEPSFAHTRKEMANPNFRRGGNLWLLRKAKDRNPGVELGALAWTQPYWVGNGAGRTDNISFYSQESAEYFVKFFQGARDEWGLNIHNFSVEQNERTVVGRRDWVIKHLRPTFDKAGLAHVKFVLDNTGWPQRPDERDPEFLNHIYALGRHYVENDPIKKSTPEAQASGKPLWNGECWSRIGSEWPLAMFWADTVARGYVESKITQFTTWPILGGGLPGSLYGTTGLMVANKPWSGHYVINPTVWLTAHFNQFAPMGWNTVDAGCGEAFVEAIPPVDGKMPTWTRTAKEPVNMARLNYLTLLSPDGKDYSFIAVNFSPFARTLEVELKNLPVKPLHQWVSTEHAQFIKTGQIDTKLGKFTLEIQPWSVHSLTTTTGQQKGPSKHAVPPDSVMALPYGDDFESYPIGADARFSSCSAGYFEVHQAPREGKTLRQMVPAKGLTWSIPKDNYPSVAIGDIRWSDYEVSSDACLEGPGTVALWARVEFFRDHGMAGYYLRVDQEGKWELGVARNKHKGTVFYTEKTLAMGKLADFKPEAWHKLAIRSEGDRLMARVDGEQVVDVTDKTYATGAVGYSTWAEAIQKDFEDVKASSVIGTKYGHARYDNLSVHPISQKPKP